ncbi:GH25 family lysozyme [Mesorhizobium sp. CAU 1741]|uniref:GH25 family lysozyme n=1 Tax=Mesorhizobium sp. CAU 1741 TaxID=3140366 RepID=UPI00325A8D34
MVTIADKYAQLKAAGFVPVPDLPVIEIPLPDFAGRFFTFASTIGPVTIYWHAATGAHEVYGAILAAYLAQGGPQGALGYPVSGEYDTLVGNGAGGLKAIGRTSDFQRGLISWDRASGQTTVSLTGPVVVGADFEQVIGIDVSTYQGQIDWTKVATQGTSDGEVAGFAYIRATHDDAGTDHRFTANWAASAGHLPRGAYHYFRAHGQPDQMRGQVDHFINTLQAAGGPGELPPMVDIESLPAGVSAAQASASLQFFLSLLEQAFGVRPLIYTYPSFWNHNMANSMAFSATYKLWIAHYGPQTADGGAAPRSTAPQLVGGWNQFALWQNAVKKGVGGITGLVDRNVAFVPAGRSLRDWLTN